MKKDTDQLYEELYNQEIESYKPLIERLEAKINKLKLDHKNTQEKLKALKVRSKTLAFDIEISSKDLQEIYNRARAQALWIIYQNLPWYQRLPKIKLGPRNNNYVGNALINIRDEIVIGEVNRRRTAKPNQPKTKDSKKKRSIATEMAEEARNHRKRCSHRTIRRIVEGGGHH